MEALIYGVFDRSKMNLLYRGDANTLASETFNNRAANCLSLSIMMYALATEAGFDVKFQEIMVPDIGGAEGAEVIEVLVAVGDEVSVDQSLIVLESDKASMEIPSTVAGRVVELLASEGDQLVETSHD